MKIPGRQILLGALWLAFVGYAFLLAPPADPVDPMSLAQIQTLVAGKGEPLVIALFNVMGLIPALYFFLLVPDGHGQRLPAWPFGLLMFAVGAFALLPYLIFRRPHSDWPQPKPVGLAVRAFDSRWLALPVVVLTLITLGSGLLAGHWSVFVQQWQQSRFIHVMSLDFALTSVLFPALLGDDMQRRGLKDHNWFWFTSLVPLLGTMVYLLLRPVLPKF